MSLFSTAKKKFSDYGKLPKSKKLENVITVSSLFFIFKIFFPNVENPVVGAVNEILMFLLLVVWIYFVQDLVHGKANRPMTLVINSGVLITAVYFLMNLFPELFDKVTVTKPPVGEQLILLLLYFGFFIAGVSVFTVLRELFFLKQKKNPKFYYDVLVFFLTAVFLTRLLIVIGIPLLSLVSALYVVVVILFAINSIRVAWIAFLTKKEKMFLLIVSIVLSTVFGLIYSLTSSSTGILNIAMNSFSPGFHSLFNLLMLYGTIAYGVIFLTTLFHLPTAEAFEKKAEEVSSLTDLTNLAANAFDFSELAENLTAHTLQISGADVAWLYVNDEQGWSVAAAQNIGKEEAFILTETVLSGFENKIPESLKILDEKTFKFKSGDSVRSLKFESLILAPLGIHNEINGCLFIGSFNYSYFDEDDRKTIKAFADYAAVSLENSFLIKKSIEKERLEKELDIARDIQHKIIPGILPKLDNLETAASFIPAFEVGGDYYDFYNREDGKITFIIADVSGKGISAAFVMAELKGIFESLASISQSPKEMLVKMNSLLAKSLTEKEFVTATVGTIDTAKGELLIARAGHTPVIIGRKGDVMRLTPAGIGLGMSGNEKFSSVLEEEKFLLQEDDLIFLFTDGVTEAQNKYDDLFGTKRIENILKENAGKLPGEISEIVITEVTLFSKDVPQRDDITFVIFKFKRNNQRK